MWFDLCALGLVVCLLFVGGAILAACATVMGASDATLYRWIDRAGSFFEWVETL